MTDGPIRRGRGRPRDPTKRAALLAAARRLFVEHGVDAVTMDQVLAQAGVSRATLYSNFADKSALIAAVIAGESERIVNDAWAQANLDAPLEAALVGFGEQLLQFIAEPETMAFERLVAHLAKQEPAHGERFFAAGPGRARGVLADLIRRAQARGDLAPADSEQAANDLMGLWQGFWRMEVQYGHRPPPDGGEIGRMARHAVGQFLRLYGRDN